MQIQNLWHKNQETNNYITQIARYLRSKDNQKMKFGQLIEYNMKTNFLKNHAKNVVEKLVPDPSLKNQNWPFLQINSLKFHAQVEDYKIYWT